LVRLVGFSVLVEFALVLEEALPARVFKSAAEILAIRVLDTTHVPIAVDMGADLVLGVRNAASLTTDARPRRANF
jgi:hypothetical protein